MYADTLLLYNLKHTVMFKAPWQQTTCRSLNVINLRENQFE